MSSKIYLIFSLFIFSCSTSNVDDNDLQTGQALIKIENAKYDATAILSHQVLAETEFEKISLIINDSVTVEILKRNFVEETIIWTIEDYNSQDIIFSLKYNYFGGSIYSPVEGLLALQKTSLIISGQFDITLSGGPYNCVLCPEALKKVKGEFIVKIE